MALADAPSYKRPFVSPSGAERSARRTGSAQKLSWGAERRDSARLSKGPPKNKGHQDRSLESRAPGRAASLRPPEPWPGVTGAAPRARGRLPAAPSPCKPCRRRRRPARPRSPTLRWDPGPGGRVHIRGTFSSRRWTGAGCGGNWRKPWLRAREPGATWGRLGLWLGRPRGGGAGGRRGAGGVLPRPAFPLRPIAVKCAPGCARREHPEPLGRPRTPPLLGPVREDST